MPKWKVILSLGAIFAAGAVTGSVLTLRVVKEVTARQISPDRWPASLLKTYEKRLKLTTEQVDKLRPVVADCHQEWQQAVRSTAGTYLGIVRRLDEQVNPLLTAEQKQIHEEMKKEVRARLRQRLNVKLPGES